MSCQELLAVSCASLCGICVWPGQGIRVAAFSFPSFRPAVCHHVWPRETWQSIHFLQPGRCQQAPKGEGDGYKDTNFAMVVASYESVLLALLSKTPRVNRTLLQTAVLKTFEGTSVDEAKYFSRQLASALVECRS